MAFPKLYLKFTGNDADFIEHSAWVGYMNEYFTQYSMKNYDGSQEWTNVHFLYYLVAGAFGYFEVTHDITKYSKAKIFSEVGKKTDMAVRFSTVGKP